jgi:hypothetical protein
MDVSAFALSSERKTRREHKCDLTEEQKHDHIGETGFHVLTPGVLNSSIQLTVVFSKSTKASQKHVACTFRAIHVHLLSR